jgi:hypothetical protein
VATLNLGILSFSLLSDGLNDVLYILLSPSDGIVTLTTRKKLSLEQCPYGKSGADDAQQ